MRKPIFLFFSLLFSIGFFSCSDEESLTPVRTTARFEQTQVSVAENSGTTTLSVTFDKAVGQNAWVSLRLKTTDVDGFITDPAVENQLIKIPVTAGQTHADFRFSPVDNAVLSPPKSITFSIESVSDGLNIGSSSEVTITITDDESPARVNFLLNIGSIRENSTNGATVMIAFSHPSPGSGSLDISFSSDKVVYGTHFITEPASVNGKITLPVDAGANHIFFRVIPVNDQSYNGDRAISYRLTSASGAISIGEGVSHQLTITDDEMAGLAKGYETFSGAWRYKRTYEYNESGLLAKIYWEQNTPGFSSGTYTFEYDGNGRLVKKIESGTSLTHYVWEGGQIVKSEKYDNGELKQYILYGYDEAGNVGEAAIHFRQPSGELILSIVNVYLYYTNGNLYKKLAYSPVENSEEMNLLSEETFENYTNKFNPFPMVEVLPNVNTQSWLPLDYRLKQGEVNLFYQFNYEFDSEGRPTRRTTNNGLEISNYFYY
jgi:hypothetical protein